MEKSDRASGVRLTTLFTLMTVALEEIVVVVVAVVGVSRSRCSRRSSGSSNTSSIDTMAVIFLNLCALKLFRNYLNLLYRHCIKNEDFH